MRHRKVESWNEESVRTNLVLSFSPSQFGYCLRDEYCSTLSTKEVCEGVGNGTGAPDSEQSDSVQAVAGFVCPPRRAFHSSLPALFFMVML